MTDKATDIFKNAPIPKAVLVNIIPSIIGMIMVLVYNLADTFFIGQTSNPFMVAAVSLATPIFLLFMAIGMLFGIGGTSMISRLMGEGKREKAKNVSAFCFWTSLAVGIIGMISIWVFINPICKLVGTSPDTVNYVKQYLNIIAFGVPFLIVGNCFSNILRSEGQANKAMMGMIIGNMTNIILDPILILVFDWNVAGAAIATVLGNIIAGIFYVSHFFIGKSVLSINIKHYKVKDHVATGVLLIGIPASLNSVLMSCSNILVNNFMKQFGDMALAGLGVAMKVNMIAVMLLIGLGVGIQPLLGYCFGAGDRKRFVGVFKFSLLLAICLSLVMSVICYFGAGAMVNAFLDNKDAYSYGMNFTRVLIISGPILGILFVLINTLQAMGAALPSLILSISRQGFIYIPILFLFNHMFHSAERIALAQPVTDYFAVILAFILYTVTFRKYFQKKKKLET